jgi:hypothetical protein
MFGHEGLGTMTRQFWTEAWQSRANIAKVAESGSTARSAFNVRRTNGSLGILAAKSCRIFGKIVPSRIGGTFGVSR